MSNFDGEEPDIGFLTRWTVIAAALLALFLIISTSMIQIFRPAWMAFDREVQQNSHQYIDAKESMLTQWIAEHDRLGTEALKYDDADKPELARSVRLQQASLLIRIQTEAQRIPVGATPPNVSFFLETH